MRLLPTCRDVTQRLLRSAEEPLRPTEQLRLRLHWLMCENCRRFAQQADTLRRALPRWRDEREP